MKSEIVVADAMRRVAAKIQEALELGNRSSHVDAFDLVEVLTSVADDLDREFAPVGSRLDVTG